MANNGTRDLRVEIELIAVHFVTPQDIKAEGISRTEVIDMSPIDSALLFVHDGERYYLYYSYSARDDLNYIEEQLRTVVPSLVGTLCKRKVSMHDIYNYQDSYLWHYGPDKNQA